LIDIKAVEMWKKYVRRTGGTNLETAGGCLRSMGLGTPISHRERKGLIMAYTYKTEQFGMSGAIGSIFKEGFSSGPPTWFRHSAIMTLTANGQPASSANVLQSCSRWTESEPPQKDGIRDEIRRDEAR
jgi:hypothetical protein